VHVSTDFVFDGRQSTPYQPEDRPNPLGVYGASKLEGERLVGSAMADALIVRTAWVYAEGGRNFVHTILRLCAERESLSVVVDQVGSPTWAPSLATAIWQALDRDVRGLHHWTDSGAISWYDFAQAIQEEALVLGLLARRVPIHPIRSAEYPTPATRPHYSVLDCSGLARAIGHVPPYWRDNLRQMLKNHAETLRNHA
jgi:dTDP-4-dehydrorhamnose reductase